MRSYPFRFALVALATLTLHFAVLLGVHAPIKAEYWVRELMIVKRDEASHMTSPKIVVAGGSATLFGFDARSASQSLGRPVMNFGLHAGLQLRRILDEVAPSLGAGDTLVLALEPIYYGCGTGLWTDWQIRNALAWDHDYFDGLPIAKRLRTAFYAGSPSLALDIAATRVSAALTPGKFEERTDALASAEDILRRYRSGGQHTNAFAYSAYNIDDHGTMLNNEGAHYSGPAADPSRPAAVCADILQKLADFAQAMKERRVSVAVAYPPYLVEGEPEPAWRDADRAFRADLEGIGLPVIGDRAEAFLPRPMFFNTDLHLNTEGRKIYTQRMIGALRESLSSQPSR